MKTSKQIDREYVNVNVGLRIEDYFRLKFKAEEEGYSNLASFMRDMIQNAICINTPEKEDEQMRLEV